MAISSAPRHALAAHRGPLAFVAILGAIAVGLPGCAMGTGAATMQGSGTVAAQLRTVGQFSRIDLTGSSSVTVATGGRQSIVVHADSNLIGRVTTRVVGDTLVIGTTGSFTTRIPMSVEVSVPSLTTLTLSGSGQISASGISVPSLNVTLSGSGTLNASGTAAQLEVTLSGSGQAELSQLAARDVHAVVAGSGLIRVTATASLNAAVPGEGAIVYGGDPPQVTTSITGTGAVTRG